MKANPAPGFARNPDKVLTIEPYDGIVTVTANGETIARTSRAKLLSEPPYPGAYYVPFEDIDFARLSRTSHSSHCPYKGDASYWNVNALGDTGKNAMWAYEAPFDESAPIKDHGAFYPDRVTISAE